MLLLCSEEPLMKRCISTGGTALLLKPLPLPVTEFAYQQITKAFGLADKSPEDRIKALLEMPVNDLWQKVPRGAPLLPSLDGDTMPGTATFDIMSAQDERAEFPLPGKKWCASLMIGESQLDVCLFSRAFVITLANTVSQTF
jgi:hypothetical protein